MARLISLFLVLFILFVAPAQAQKDVGELDSATIAKLMAVKAVRDSVTIALIYDQAGIFAVMDTLKLPVEYLTVGVKKEIQISPTAFERIIEFFDVYRILPSGTIRSKNKDGRYVAIATSSKWSLKLRDPVKGQFWEVVILETPFK